MKQKICKMLSLMLAVILLLSSVVGIEAVADSNTIIYEVDLINVPSPTVGVTATPYTYTYSDSGTDVYTATGEWSVYNNDTFEYNPIGTTDTFVADKSYRLYITITPATGYVFEDYVCTFKVDGEIFYNGQAYNNTGYVSLYFPGGTPIENVTLDEDVFPKAEIGKPFEDTDKIKLTLPAGSNYTVVGSWNDEAGNTNGTFENGKVYYFNYVVGPKAGYCFNENTEFYICGENNGPLASDGIQYFNSAHRASFKTVIDTVELLDAPTAEVGKTLKASPDINVPDGAKYSVESAWWTDFDTYMPIDTDTTAQKSKAYDLNFHIIPDNGYEFAEYVILKINGASHRVYTQRDDINYARTYDFRTTIDRIEVTGVTKPVIGAAPTTDGLKVADADKYEIIYAEWMDILPNDTVPATKFEDGHMYMLNVEVAAKGDYWIAPRATLLFDGEERHSLWNAEKTVSLYTQYDFMKLLDEVRIENVPEFKVGASTPTDGIVTDLKTPDGANYSINNAQWFVLKNGRFTEFSGVFEKGKYYSLKIDITWKDGYKADVEETAFYVNGSKVSDKDIFIGSFEAEIFTYFSEDVKLIDRVELTVEKPVIGDHSSMLPIITAKNNTNYSVLSESFWIVGNSDSYSHFNGYFSADEKNGVRITLIPNDGYIFSDNLIVIINGKVLSAEEFECAFEGIDIPYFYSDKCAHIYTDANDDTCDVCGATREIPKSPKTGDNTAMLLLTAIIASGALLIISQKRKINNR